MPEGSILHYQIQRKLGEGGMGEVYLATDTRLDRQVALKFLPESLRKNPEARERLLREAKAASKLSHANIVTVYAVEEADGRDFIAMEYVEGLMLSEYAATRKPTLKDALGIGVGIASGLQKAHEAGIVHRDLKPGNIVVDKDGKAKILDFGVAKMRGAAKLTETGSTVGTVAYMSPEQAQGAEVDARSDLFGLGVMMYELVAGQAPFRGEHKAAVMYAITHELPDPLARFKPDAPDELQRILTKCLAKSPSERYQSAADLAADLKQLRKSLDGTKSSYSTVTATIAAPATPSRAKWWLAGGALVTLVTLAIVFKPMKITVESTQEAAAVANRLAILYFDNFAEVGDPKRLGEIAANLLITDLSESPNLDVISQQRLYDILKQIGHEGEKQIDRAVATQVAQTAQARWMLLGSVLQTEPTLVITAQVVDLSSGSTVATQKVEGQSGENLFAVVGRLTQEVKADLALPAATGAVNADANPADVTTSSPEAYRLYLEGVELRAQHKYSQAREVLLKSVAIDSQFAMAYYELSKVSGGKERVAFAEAARRHADHASPKERAMIEFYHAGNAQKDFRKALGMTREFTQRYPTEPLGYMGMSFAYSELGLLDSAALALESLIAVDPINREGFNLLAYRHQALGNFDRSVWAINKYIELAPDEPNPYDSRADLYAYEGKIEEAAQLYRQVLTIDPDFLMSALKLGYMQVALEQFDSAAVRFQSLTSAATPEIRIQARYGLAAIFAYQGRRDQAIRTLQQGIAAGTLDAREQWLSGYYWGEAKLRAEWGDTSGALEVIRRAMDTQDSAVLDDRMWLRPFELELLTRSGRLPEADRLMSQLTSDWKRFGPLEENDVYYASLAVLAGARGETGEAVKLYGQASRLYSDFLVRFWLGCAYLADGKLSSAVDTLEAAARRYDEPRFLSMVDEITIYYFLGQAYEQSGWNDKAIENYTKFLHLWRNADPVPAKVVDAKARLAKLQGAS